MTLQTDLQDAVTRVESDSQILHNIIHGNDQTTVNTENGNVKTPAKAIKDIEDTIQAGLTDIGAVGQQLNQAIDQAETYAQDAQVHA
ncbi:MAG: hypothetical protein COB76_06605, partial [Alphaproteobacteria bacterium]